MKVRIPVVHILVYAALGLTTTFVFIILYWLYSPPKEALTVSPYPITVLSKKVKADSYVILQTTRCKHVKSAGRITSTLVGEKVQIPLPAINDTSGRDCTPPDTKVPYPIPPLTTPGTYFLRFRVTYKVNPLTTIMQELDTEPFEVIE